MVGRALCGVAELLIYIALAAPGCEFAWGAILWGGRWKHKNGELSKQDFSLLPGKQCRVLSSGAEPLPILGCFSAPSITQ